MFVIGDIVVCTRFKRMNKVIPVLNIWEKQAVLDIIHWHLKVYWVNDNWERETAYYHPSWFMRVHDIEEAEKRNNFKKDEMMLYSMWYCFNGKKISWETFHSEYYRLWWKLSPISRSLVLDILNQNI